MAWLHLQRGILPLYRNVLRQESQEWLVELISTVALPITYSLAFGLGLRDYLTRVDGVPYIVFLTPGLISVTIVLEGFRNGAWGLWLDRWHQRMIEEYRIKPISTSDIIIGQIFGSVTVATVKGLIVGAILLLITPVALNPAHLLPYALYMLAGNVLFTCLGVMVGMSFRKPDQIAQSLSIVITPLLYLGGLFFPISAFPERIKPFIYWLPTTALFDGSRKALLNGSVQWDQLTILYLMAVFSFFLATWLFNKKLSE